MVRSRLKAVVGAVAAMPLVVVMSAVVLAQGAAMRPGRYEMSAEMTMSGSPVKLPPSKQASCVTPDDLKDWSRSMVKAPDGTTCTLTEYKTSGNSLKYLRECTNQAGVKTSYAGDVTFMPPDSYHAVVVVSSSKPTPGPFGGGATMNITARRVGDCAK